jgi:hypothetical protein
VTDWLKGNGLKDHPSWVLTALGDEIDQFRSAKVGHLFVGGRFDGMDFKGDECRIVVLTTLPRAINLQEDFISSYLRDSGFMRRRLNQRIVQALGRCNRAENDFGVYFLADQRFATHFAREANREGIPRNMMAELDLAQELAEKSDIEIADTVKAFLKEDFADFDAALAPIAKALPPARLRITGPDTSNDEVLGWAAMFDSENFPVAEERFEHCWNTAKKENLIEICALHGWHWSKALYLSGTLGDRARRGRSLRILEEAIARGGRSSWFNRMRASLARAQSSGAVHGGPTQVDYGESLIRSFDEVLERVGTSGDRFQRHLDSIRSGLVSEKHATFQEGLEGFGKLLGFGSSRPKYGSATDCRWRGVFGNHREVFTFEAKVEHRSGAKISAGDVGQAHNQRSRALAEFGNGGYLVRSLLVTHMPDLHPDAKVALGELRILPKDTVVHLFDQVGAVFTAYRSHWSLDDMAIRSTAADVIRPRIPKSGWLIRAIDSGSMALTSDVVLREWR